MVELLPVLRVLHRVLVEPLHGPKTFRGEGEGCFLSHSVEDIEAAVKGAQQRIAGHRDLLQSQFRGPEPVHRRVGLQGDAVGLRVDPE